MVQRERALAAALLLLLLLLPVAAGYPLPAVPNVLNVRDWGAKGDGTTDDTASIRRAIAFARAQGNTTLIPWSHGAPVYVPRVLYLPAGRYLVSDTLQLYPDPVLDPQGGVPDNYFEVSLQLLVMGDGADLTSVVLRDRAPGFGDRAKPRPVWLTFPLTHHNDGQWLCAPDPPPHPASGSSSRRCVATAGGTRT